MAISRNDTSSSIALLNFALVDDVTCSPPYLVDCNSLAIHLFLPIKNLTLGLVASTYALVASTIVVGFLSTSDMITRSCILHFMTCNGFSFFLGY